MYLWCGIGRSAVFRRLDTRAVAFWTPSHENAAKNLVRMDVLDITVNICS